MHGQWVSLEGALHPQQSSGASNDPKANAVVRFAVTVTRGRGQVSDTDIRALKEAGYDDAQPIEIVLHVALNTWTNYINQIAQTEIDFPVIAPRKVREKQAASRPPADTWSAAYLAL